MFVAATVGGWGMTKNKRKHCLADAIGPSIHAPCAKPRKDQRDIYLTKGTYLDDFKFALRNNSIFVLVYV